MSITWIVEPSKDSWSCCVRDFKCHNGHVVGQVPRYAYFSFRCPTCNSWDQVASMGPHFSECPIRIASDRAEAVEMVTEFWKPIRELRGPGQIRRARDEYDDD